MSRRTIVLLKLDQVFHPEFTLKSHHIANVGTAKAINTLIVIAHGKHHITRASEQLQPAVLETVRVLKLIDQNMTKAQLIVLAQ